MDWLKLFALLVAVATVRISAEGPKKKIRIHLPQKVKHIHHHKKIYITNHPAASQYAPAYMPSAEDAMAVGTSMALPGAVAGLLPVNSVEMIEEPRAPAGSKLVPMYRARGYYGPQPTEWDDQEYDLSPPPEPTDQSYPTAFSGPSAVVAPIATYPKKKVKIIKVNDPPRKKAIRKGKPKGTPVRPKPQMDEEIPVSTFHEQFYSDLDGSATLKKVKKPQRVEKIVDGDTEHIHTYSEEHIHKLIYDDGSTKLIGVNPVGGMSALSASHSLFPIQSPLLALQSGALTGFATIGSMGTPSQLEYAAYNPRDVTHDHVFHDHGELPSDADVSKENLPFPISYNSQGIRIGDLGWKGHKAKFPQSYPKPTRPTAPNYSYYENMYSSYGNPRHLKPSNPSNVFPSTTESSIDYEYKPIPSFKLRNKGNVKAHNVVPQTSALYFGHGKQVPDFRTQQSNDPAPFAVSSTIVHDYKPKSYAGHMSGTLGFNKYNDPLQNFKDNSYNNNFDLDSFASTSDLFTSDTKHERPLFNFQGKRGKKKSISTQSIRIGGLDHQTTVDHLGDSGLSVNDGGPTAFGSDFTQTKLLDSATSTPYTIRASSFAHPYYMSMAAKALRGDQTHVAEASNTNFQYVEAPSPSTTEFAPVATTNAPIPMQTDYFEQESTDSVPTEIIESPEYFIETRPKHRTKDSKKSLTSIVNDTRPRYSVLDSETKDYKSVERPLHHSTKHIHNHGKETAGSTESRKYGDKI